MRSKDSAMTALTPSSAVPLAAQSREDSRAVLLAAQDHQRDSGGLVGLGGVEDRLLLAGEEVTGVAALDAVEQPVAQADVGEGAADHDLVVTAARAVGVEVRAGTPCSAR